MELSAQSVLAASADAGIALSTIDGISIYSFAHQWVNPYELASSLGLAPLKWGTSAVIGPAFIQIALEAIAAVASGSADVVVAVRTIKQAGSNTNTARGVKESGSTKWFFEDHASGYEQFLHPFGTGHPTQFAAMFMRRMMHEYGWTEQDFGRVAVTQREFAALNENAIYRDRLTLEQYMDSPYIARPLRLLDCDYPVDASGAVIFTTEERARDMRQPVVTVESWGFATTAQHQFELQPDMVTSASHLAARRMWETSNVRPSDVDVAGLYDGFSFIALDWIEAFGFCERGGAAEWVSSGQTGLGGSVPANCDGGALNVGRLHGVNQITEVVSQLRGQSASRQRQNAEIGVASNATGAFAGCMAMVRV